MISCVFQSVMQRSDYLVVFVPFDSSTLGYDGLDAGVAMRLQNHVLSDIFESAPKFCCIHGLGFEWSIHRARCLTKVFAEHHVEGEFLN